MRLSAAGVDLSPRVKYSTTVVASPAAASETTICSVTIDANVATPLGILLLGWCAYTVGGSGVSVTLKLRRTDTSGTTVATTGATTAVAGNLRHGDVIGFDTGPTLPGQVYVLTMTVGSGAAESTVSAVALAALVV